MTNHNHHTNAGMEHEFWYRSIYAIISLAVGASLILQPILSLGRDFAEHILPLQAWGVLFIVLGLVVLYGSILRKRTVVVPTLIAAGVIYTFWTILFLVTSFTDFPHVPFTIAANYAFIAGSHFAAGRVEYRKSQLIMYAPPIPGKR